MTKRRPKPSDPAKAQAFTGMLRAKFGKADPSKGQVLGEKARQKVNGASTAERERLREGAKRLIQLGALSTKDVVTGRTVRS